MEDNLAIVQPPGYNFITRKLYKMLQSYLNNKAAVCYEKLELQIVNQNKNNKIVLI